VPTKRINRCNPKDDSEIIYVKEIKKEYYIKANDSMNKNGKN
jgi:hypothetical protein